MPNDRLLTMGLLSKYPRKSWILQHFLSPTDNRWYSDDEKMHMTALYWTPGISKPWIKHQFATYSDRNPDHLMRFLRRHAYNPKNRERWEHLGQRNITYIDATAAKYYCDRRPPGKMHIPDWMRVIWNDHLKQGWTLKQIGEHYGFHMNVVWKQTQKSMFDKRVYRLPPWVERKPQ